MLEINRDKDRFWYNEKGKRHRIGGPAVEYSDGTKYWYVNGKIHRKDGPAVELNDGTKCWYVNNQLHRIDGPAVENIDGTKEYCIHDYEYTEKKYIKKVKKKRK